MKSIATPPPLKHTLEDYRNAPSEGPLHATWKDKPHRIVYDLVSALADKDAEIAALRKELGNAKGLICEVYSLLPLLTPATNLIERKTGNWFTFGVDHNKTKAVQPTLICPTCKADRLKEDCKGIRYNCGLKFVAQAVQP